MLCVIDYPLSSSHGSSSGPLTHHHCAHTTLPPHHRTQAAYASVEPDLAGLNLDGLLNLFASMRFRGNHPLPQAEVKALQTAQQNFVITDPSLPDNPIVFASSGFLTLTGYALESVLGRNCRFLQGPRTDPKAVAKIRKAVDEGYDTSVCLLNYRIDGSTFYNQFFVAPLRDGQGNVVNYVGVQCQVSDQFASAVSRDDVSSLPPLG